MEPILKKKKGLTFYLRFAISLLLIYYVFRKAGLSQLWTVIQQTNFLFLMLSIAIAPVLIFLSSWKWQILLQAQNIRVPQYHLFGLYMVGYFFNTVLPTNVGGDIVRAYNLGRSLNKQAEVFSSVFLERFTGLTALIFMAVLAFFLTIKKLGEVNLIIAMVVSVVGYLAIIFVIWDRRILTFFRAKINLKSAQKVFEKLAKFQNATVAIKNHRSCLAFAIINSFVFNLVAALNVYLSSLAFNYNLGYVNALIITPIILVITMIPISIGGIGLSEWAYYFSFSNMVAAGPIGLSVALLMRAKALLFGLIGGAYYSTTDYKVDQMTEKSSTSDAIKSNVNYFSGFEAVMKDGRKSPLAKYQDITMGNYSIWHLIKFELIITFLGQIPGLLGMFLRQKTYRSLFKKFGRGVIMGRNVTLRHTGKIEIGDRCVIDEYCMLSAQGDDSSAITLGNEVLLGRDTVVSTRGGTIEIGAYSNIGASCRIGTTSHVKLGKYVLIAAYTYIGGAHHRIDRLDVPIIRQGFLNKGGVEIGDGAWIAADVKIVDGVKIGEGAVIGAGAVVTKDIPPYAIAAGIPARVIGTRKPGEIKVAATLSQE